MSERNWGRELLVRAGFLAAGLVLGLGYGVGARADHVQAPAGGVEYIVLEPQECDQVAAEVALNVAELQGAQKIERGGLTVNAAAVVKFIMENNPDIKKHSPDELFMFLLQTCYAAQGVTEIPVTH